MRTCSVEGCDRKCRARGLCKQCYNKKWQSENKQKVAAYSRKWYSGNKEIPIGRIKKRYSENKEIVIERNRKWQSANKQKVVENSRKWRRESLSDGRVKMFLCRESPISVPDELVEVGRKLLKLKRELK